MTAGMEAAPPDVPPGLEDTLPLLIAGQPRGRLIPAVAAAIAGMERLFMPAGAGHALRDAGLAPPARSRLLQEAATGLRELALVPGWRDELCELRDEAGELARFERGAFRTLGLCNRAVHINGWREDGRLWVARRSATKASSPGMLDNLAAGAISAGESPRLAATRELWEEAGVPAGLAQQMTFPGSNIRSLRRIEHGVHDEIIVCIDLLLPADFQPRCRDGEVQAFYCMDIDEVQAALAHEEFSHEAALATADWLQRRPQLPSP